MRPLPFLVTLVCLVLSTVLGVDLWNRRSARTEIAAPPRTPPDSPRPAPGKHPIPDRAARPADSAAAVTGGDRPASDPERAGLAVSARLALDRWRLDPTLGERLAVHESDPSLAGLVAEWRLKRALIRDSERQLAPLPAEVREVTLANGQTLWIRGAESTPEGEALTLVDGIRTTLPAGEIRATRSHSRVEYLERTRAEYERRVRDLDRSSPFAIAEAIAHALRRDDIATADPLYREWLAAGGPFVLAHRSTGDEADALLRSAAALGAKEGRPAGPASERGTATVARPDLAAEIADVPESLDDLKQRVRAARTRVPRALDAAERQALIDAAIRWEEWLDRGGKTEAKDPEELRVLRRDLQFLRLDLLKAGGF